MRTQNEGSGSSIRSNCPFSGRGPDDGPKNRIHKAATESYENHISGHRDGHPYHRHLPSRHNHARRAPATDTRKFLVLVVTLRQLETPLNVLITRAHISKARS
jgi:hypothetical protein